LAQGTGSGVVKVGYGAGQAAALKRFEVQEARGPVRQVVSSQTAPSVASHAVQPVTQEKMKHAVTPSKR
jgi:hypothetical protein